MNAKRKEDRLSYLVQTHAVRTHRLWLYFHFANDRPKAEKKVNVRHHVGLVISFTFTYFCSCVSVCVHARSGCFASNRNGAIECCSCNNIDLEVKWRGEWERKWIRNWKSCSIFLFRILIVPLCLAPYRICTHNTHSFAIAPSKYNFEWQIRYYHRRLASPSTIFSLVQSQTIRCDAEEKWMRVSLNRWRSSCVCKSIWNAYRRTHLSQQKRKNPNFGIGVQ